MHKSVRETAVPLTLEGFFVFVFVFCVGYLGREVINLLEEEMANRKLQMQN